MSLIAELKRRNVFKVGVAYVVVAWLVLQLSDVILNNIEAPGWVFGAIMLVLGIGLPVVLVFAWAFELTPEGLKRDHEVDRTQSISQQTGKKLNTTILLLMAAAIAYLLFDKFMGSADLGSESSSREIAEQGEATPGNSTLTPDNVTPSRQSIAVLPFTNRSPNPDDAYFTDGIHDDLLTTLARIKALKVISRTSVMEYRDTTKKIPQIAAELGVGHVLEGGIQRSGDQVRINVQLIDAATDEHLWAEIFDRKLSAENLFAIQSEISQAIADALQATLTPEEEQRINAMPTENLAAYDAYLRGKQLMVTREAEDMEQAMLEFRRALDLDPGFALAWVGLADTAALLMNYGTLPEAESLRIQEDAVQRALAIDARLGEAYTSLGNIRGTQRRYAEMEEAYRKGIELSPNYATAWHWYSNDIRQFLSRAEDSAKLARRAAEIDPRSAIIGANLAESYSNQGLYSLAEQQLRKVIELHPDFTLGYRGLAQLNLFSLGRYDLAMEYVTQALQLEPEGLLNHANKFLVLLELGDVDGAEQVRRQIEEIDAQNWRLGFADLLINQARGNVQGTQEAWSWLSSRMPGSLPFVAASAAMIMLSHGDAAQALATILDFESGWRQPDEWPRLIDFDPGNACLVAYAFTQTGEPELGAQLLQQSRAAFEALAASIEHIDLYNPQICQMMAGDTQAALTTIETQLAHGHLYQWQILDSLPMYEPIRFDPRYQAALAERELRITGQRERIEALRAEGRL